MDREHDAKRQYWDKRKGRPAQQQLDAEGLVGELNRRLTLELGPESGVRFDVDLSRQQPVLVWRGPKSADGVVLRLYRTAVAAGEALFPLQLDPAAP